ncbi:hypothetical protein IJG14_06555 [bacterium]|nr:hypothetical protein [bacterium]
METWSIEILIKTFKYIAIFSTLLYMIKFIIFSFTVDDSSDISSNFDITKNVDGSLDLFSMQSILAFLMGFSWISIVCVIQWELSIQKSLFISIVAGVLCMLLSAYLILKIKHFYSFINSDYKNSVGTVGKAYSDIQPKSLGQASLNIDGKLTVINVINQSDTEIKTLDLIKVVRYLNGKIYVEKDTTEREF